MGIIGRPKTHLKILGLNHKEPKCFVRSGQVSTD